jgi:hypothetical protein
MKELLDILVNLKMIKIIMIGLVLNGIKKELVKMMEKYMVSIYIINNIRKKILSNKKNDFNFFNFRRF